MAIRNRNSLKVIRKRERLKPVQLAVAADVSLSYLYILESGESLPGLDVARRLARALGTTIDAIWPAQEAA